MCTIMLLYKQLSDFPIVVAMNRDGLNDRLEKPPSFLSEYPVVFAPEDVKSGGTWIGVNEYKLFAALTNGYQPDRELIANNRSRGILVLDVLKKARNPQEAIELVNKQCSENYENSEDRFKFFNLFLLSADEAFLLKYNGKTDVEELKAGTFFHYSSGYDDGLVKKLREGRLNELFHDYRSSSIDACLGKLKESCRDHFDRAPYETDVCMHGNPRRTISSTLFAIPDKDLSKLKCEYLFGYPCEKNYTKIIPNFSNSMLELK